MFYCITSAKLQELKLDAVQCVHNTPNVFFFLFIYENVTYVRDYRGQFIDRISFLKYHNSR